MGELSDLVLLLQKKLQQIDDLETEIQNARKEIAALKSAIGVDGRCVAKTQETTESISQKVIGVLGELGGSATKTEITRSLRKCTGSQIDKALNMLASKNDVCLSYRFTTGRPKMFVSLAKATT